MLVVEFMVEEFFLLCELMFCKVDVFVLFFVQEGFLVFNIRIIVVEINVIF